MLRRDANFTPVPGFTDLTNGRGDNFHANRSQIKQSMGFTQQVAGLSLIMMDQCLDKLGSKPFGWGGALGWAGGRTAGNGFGLDPIAFILFNSLTALLIVMPLSTRFLIQRKMATSRSEYSR